MIKFREITNIFSLIWQQKPYFSGFSTYAFQYPAFNYFPILNFSVPLNFGFDVFKRTSGVAKTIASSASNAVRTVGQTVGACKSVASIAAGCVGKYAAATAKRMFSAQGNHGGGWCIDFATYCAKKGLKNYPKSMVTASPAHLIKEANKYKCYKTAPSTGKSSWAVQNIKPGDIVITGGNGASGKHAIVVKEIVNKSGQTYVRAYSGNDGGGVCLTDWPVEKGRYSKKKGGWNMPIYGVINLSQFA
ncbi:hypothetical protein IJ750_04895 [bacterium]|nr:hypothetical protein [bacterium]